ncbi:hypothetical protein FQA47_014997 [Oryzias melastigma]|uniref:Uncharacterized protein n=1 Tax=Oryzias melastigma TaxID=30732 RepID=A0A834L175_ORYME|nr:hypothetical protein FQA47_014997 [Oryzias melastigma]
MIFLTPKVIKIRPKIPIFDSFVSDLRRYCSVFSTLELRPTPQSAASIHPFIHRIDSLYLKRRIYKRAVPTRRTRLPAAPDPAGTAASIPNPSRQKCEQRVYFGPQMR